MKQFFSIIIVAVMLMQSGYSQCVDASTLPTFSCLPLGGDQTFTNQGSTNNGTAPNPTCSFGTGSTSTSTWVVFTYTGPPDMHYITASQGAGGAGNDPAMAIYSYDGCTVLACSDDNPDATSGAGPCPGEEANNGKIDLTTLGLEIGQQYLIRVYNEGNTANSKSALIHCTPTAPPGDCFTDPVVVTNINTTFITSTNGSHPDDCCLWAEDSKGAVAALNCPGPGAISSDGNSYYSFSICGSGTVTATLDYSGCSDGAGAQIWFVTGCNGSVIGNQCHNEGDMSTATLTYSSFTVGETYYIMVDSYGGNMCDIELTMTGPVCIVLGDEISNFDAKVNKNKDVEVSWISENSMGDFVLERSYDGENFEQIHYAHGSHNNLLYKFVDRKVSPTQDLAYYRINTKNQDGVVNPTEVKAVKLKKELNVFFYASSNGLEFNIGEKHKDVTIDVYNAMGQKLYSVHYDVLNEGSHSLTNSNLNSSGIFFIVFRTESNVDTFKFLN